MRILIDTHTFLWFVLKDARLSRPAMSLITDPTNVILVSPATYWEIAVKVGKKRLELFAPYEDFMNRGIHGNDFEILPIEIRHTALLTILPDHHKDPFDRVLIAQALVEGIPIVSIDSAFDAYGASRIW